MPNSAKVAALLTRASSLSSRADGLVAAAGHPSMREALAMVSLAARDAQTWAVDAALDLDALNQVEASLDAQTSRLDDFETKLRTRADARP